MNRRRILSSVHRSIARQAAVDVAPLDHSTIERLSIADLDRIGPRLVTTAPPRESTTCLYCTSASASDANFPYCSPICAINAQQEDDDD